MHLQTFLNSKPLYYSEIDYTRMARAYASLKEKLKVPPIIHLIGTNAKGSTGRFIATALYRAGYNVGHYTSPHIQHFNERIWFNNQHVDDATLQTAHQKLLEMLPSEFIESLSYFEYTTFLAMVVYAEADYVVLEAGLGGEHDATAVFDNILSVVTPIDFDHETFLGNTIEAIATTKLNAVRHKAVLAKQKHKQVYEIAKRLASTKQISIVHVEDITSFEEEMISQALQVQENLPPYMQDNLHVAMAVLKVLDIPFDIRSFQNARLFGRLTPLTKNIYLDVGHNPLAAEAIVQALEGDEWTLVYNTYKDKNYQEILAVLQKKIKKVEIIEIEDERIVPKEELQGELQKMGMQYGDFTQIEKEKPYLVFGSFAVVQRFLEVYGG